jgi:catechol 2,3-dioxygenase-like lactoylglutathione lyase family enzyme
MEILSGRVLLTSPDPMRSRRFYAGVLGLAIYREYGPADSPGTVFFAGQGFLEVPGHPSAPAPSGEPSSAAGGARAMLWLQVRDVRAECARLTSLGVRIERSPTLEPWGLIEMWISDPDGVPIVLVEVPQDHPLRRDQR